MGCDSRFFIDSDCSSKFKSTQPEWAATKSRKCPHFVHFYLNPRSPSGLRHLAASATGSTVGLFKSTQPEWAATRREPKPIRRFGFKSTQPEWAATLDEGISFDTKIFKSTQPEWAATTDSTRLAEVKAFKSTQPEWAATCFTSLTVKAQQLFKSTQPEWAATCLLKPCASRLQYLNPRSPSGLRLRWNNNNYQSRYLNPRSPSGLRHCP